MRTMETIGQFFDALPALLAPRPSLHIVFLTYNTVHGHERDGVVETSKSGLRISVFNGNQQSSVTFFEEKETGAAPVEVNPLDPIAPTVDARTVEMLHAEASGALASAERTFRRSERAVPCDRAAHLYCMYAGRNAFHEALAFAERLHREQGDAAIVLVTCTCEGEMKFRLLRHVLSSGVLTHAIMTPECMGQETMRSILDVCVLEWPHGQ